MRSTNTARATTCASAWRFGGRSHLLRDHEGFGNLNWADMPFTTWASISPTCCPPREPDAGYVWHYELVDLAGIVHSLGIFTVTPTFSALFEQQIAKLRKNLWMFSPAKHQAEIAAFYRHYPDQNRMTPAAIIIEKAGMRFPR